MGETVFDTFDRTARTARDHVFLCAPPAAARAYHPEGVEFTSGQPGEAAEALRDASRAAGYGHGPRVAPLLENRPEFFFHFLALNALGVSIVPVNPDYRHDELLYLVEHSEADLAVVIGSRVADLERVAGERAKPLPGVDAERWPVRLPAAGCQPRAVARGRAGVGQRDEADVRFGHPWPPQGLHPHQLLLPERGRLVPRSRRAHSDRARAGALPQPVAALPHERAGGDGDVRHAHRELHFPTPALQPESLVAGRRGLAGGPHPLTPRECTPGSASA